MVAKTQFAITGEDTRFFLNGAKFMTRARLADAGGDRRTPPGAGGREALAGRRRSEIGVILPKKTLLEVGKLVADGDGDVSFEQGENHLFFDVDGRTLISRMIDGQFPAFERVIPEGQRQDHRIRPRAPDQRRQARCAAVERTLAGR